MPGPYHHGNSPAAWTGVVIAFIGFGIGGAYTVMAEPLGVAAGAVVVGLGGVVGLVLRAMGYGQPPAQFHATPAQKARAQAAAAGVTTTADGVPAPATSTESERSAVSG
ncbi:HGxxPAAW family protein [Streptomyces sp. URMC 129]|uniref:HGxxPAAW family protein n=1 Tax=Streptomyces sp. URMC 129 TaxID=3423407 RepID=UPI003F1D2969